MYHRVILLHRSGATKYFILSVTWFSIKYYECVYVSVFLPYVFGLQIASSLPRIILSSVACLAVELVRNLVAHGDAREGKWRGNWRMEWVASTLTPHPNVVYPALLKLMRTPRLPTVDWTDVPTDLNGLVRFGERRNVVSARVPSRSARAIPHFSTLSHEWHDFRKIKILNVICFFLSLQLCLKHFSFYEELGGWGW